MVQQDSGGSKETRVIIRDDLQDQMTGLKEERLDFAGARPTLFVTRAGLLSGVD
ncbi:hypothetical protein PtA15_3A321 [Puccinia triticina]|uniref:Uncharacterized protein n=1 Tax=Puccinia triticina TaxID=208348 RepID=A0ABY7CGJ3_9BASI|nr:uncharacterized protein PtA15_3A321 [Puccinia triticina]WAQ82955.1 hypothetical protein PtA15_3A321 [Puccinia triticina]WAR53781.1 hypothetical protein PtB15_3B290 [Puccinia triticina]